MTQALEQKLEDLQKDLGPLDEAYMQERIDIRARITQATRAGFEQRLRTRIIGFDLLPLSKDYPDIQTSEQATLLHKTLQNIQHGFWRSQETSLEMAIAQTTSRMSKEEIGALPDSLRIELLHTMSTNLQQEYESGDQHNYMNKQRFRLALGEEPEQVKKDAPINFDAARSLSLSRETVKWQTGKEEELKRIESQFYKENPDYAEIRDLWQQDKTQVSSEEKNALLENLHGIHAEVFGYVPKPIVSIFMPDTGALALDIKMGENTGLIIINPHKMEQMGYDEARDIILHESDHIAQFSWMRNFESLAQDDPRHDYVRRSIAFDGIHTVGPAVDSFGITGEGSVLYRAKPQEAHAYALHDPHSHNPYHKPKDFSEKQTCLPGICP